MSGSCAAPSRRLTGGARVRGIQRRHGLKAAGRPSGQLLDHLEVNDLLGRGLEAFRAGDFHEAARHYSQVIALRPEDGAGYFNRGLVYRRLGLPEPAVRDYDAALALDRGHSRALLDRGNAHAEMGRYRAAALDYADSLSYRLFGASPVRYLVQELGELSDAAKSAIR
jgi:tetratricopeptide (TPR) repeat protein